VKIESNQNYTSMKLESLAIGAFPESWAGEAAVVVEESELDERLDVGLLFKLSEGLF
jgi:hypothetical protein